MRVGETITHPSLPAAASCLPVIGSGLYRIVVTKSPPFVNLPRSTMACVWQDDKQNAGSLFSYSSTNTHIDKLQLPICFINFFEISSKILDPAHHCHFSHINNKYTDILNKGKPTQ